MPAEVTLSSAARNSLLALRRTTSLIQVSQRRIASGLRTASAVDDPNAFFKARALRARASDFLRRKESIDQGVSAAQAGKTAADTIKSLIDQLQSTATSLKTAADTDAFNDLVRQFNSIRTQINNTAADASYNGVNLVNGTGQFLNVEISEQGDGYLRVASNDITAKGAGINDVIAPVSGDSVIEARAGTGIRATGGIYSRRVDVAGANAISQISSVYRFTYQGPDDTFGSGSYEIQYGEKTLTIRVAPGGASVTLTQGRVFDAAVTSAAGSTGNHPAGTFNSLAVVRTDLADPVPRRKYTIEDSDPSGGPDYVTEGDAASIDAVLDRLNEAENTVRAAARRLGTNVDLLTSRLEFTEKYVETLESGADKLTAVDLAAESARLTALQTRRRLGVSSLSVAAQSERGILSLIRQALEQGGGGGGLAFQAASLLEDTAGAG